MNVLFLTMNPFTGIDMHNIYSDLMCEFIRHGHRPYIVTPREKKTGEKTELLEFADYGILKVQIGNTSGVSLIEKGISTVTLSDLYYRAVKKYLGRHSFGLMLYSTPPITLAGPVKKLKKLFGCPTYLMLKDIFPQNAVDLGMFSKKSLIYTYFAAQERMLYRESDWIGCMSPANISFLRQNHPQISAEKIGLCVNSVIPRPEETIDKGALRDMLGIDRKPTVFLFGGNFGKPQGIGFLLELLRENEERSDCFFVLCGNGTEYAAVERYVRERKPANVMLLNGLPKKRYDMLVRACDVGMIVLDSRFTIPNFPSRILSYMEYGIPVWSVTDRNTDVGDVVLAGNFGWKSYSDDLAGCCRMIDEICSSSNLPEKGRNARKYLQENYTAEITYQQIWEQIYDRIHAD